MAKLSTDAEFALHEFSVRYRAGLAQQQADWEKSLATVQGAVREDYAQKQEARHNQTIEPPSAGAGHQVEDPDAGR
jgi:hypothetical protein